MKVRKKIFRGRAFVVLAFVILLQSLLPVQTQAKGKNNSNRVQIFVGAPSVWSIGQAHYLLAKMHKDNLALKTNMPDSTALDPNGINATKIQLLKTLLDVEAQFDQKIGVENQAELREQQFKIRQRDEAQAKLKEKQDELDAVDDDLARMKKKLARLQTDLTQRQAARQAQAQPNATPPVPVPQPDQSEKDLEQEVNVQKQKVANQQGEHDDLTTQVTALKTDANATVAKPNLSDVSLGTPATLPQQSDFVKDLVKNAAESIKQPRFAASIALDNFIGMQYEIIAKQLTLLRDEVGPNNRVIFLELPSSVYTVPCKGDNYLAQVKWRVTDYFQENDPEEEEEEERKKENKALSIIESLGPPIDRPRAPGAKENGESNTQAYDKLRQGKTAGEAGIKGEWKTADANTVRALDIIPRQSALNVNEVQSTVSQTNFLGIMKLLVGFGIRVNYQRQRELYEQYLQQEVFASGFGKGLNSFGWTFGPLPGTNRIAPGVRTTYAVLSVPKNTSLIKLEAEGIGYHREDAPRYETLDKATNQNLPSNQVVARENFTIIIPNRRTEEFTVREVRYTPVKKGEFVTVVIKGDYFSPQVSVLIDGVPLPKALSLGFNATSDALADASSTSGIKGQFELASSRELILKFSMSDKYIGTPNITLVTPERSASINYYPLSVLNGFKRASLMNASLVEPMFFDDFALDDKLTLIDNQSDNHVRVRIKGTGLRPRSDVWFNNRKIAYRSLYYPLLPPGRPSVEGYITANPDHEFVTQIDTGEYFLYVTPTAAEKTADKWVVRYRQQTMRSFESKETTHAFPKTTEVDVVNYTPDTNRKKAILDIRITSNEQYVTASLSPARDGRLISKPTFEGDKKYRAVFELNFEPQGNIQVEKTKVSITVIRNSSHRPQDAQRKTYDLALKVRSQITQIKIGPPLNPDADGSLITIQGLNLQQVDKVLIADQEASIVSGSDAQTLVVKMKKGVFIKQEAGLQIPVVLVLKDGTKVSAVVTVDDSNPDQNASSQNGRRHRRRQPK